MDSAGACTDANLCILVETIAAIRKCNSSTQFADRWAGWPPRLSARNKSASCWIKFVDRGDGAVIHEHDRRGADSSTSELSASSRPLPAARNGGRREPMARSRISPAESVRAKAEKVPGRDWCPAPRELDLTFTASASTSPSFSYSMATRAVRRLPVTPMTAGILATPCPITTYLRRPHGLHIPSECTHLFRVCTSLRTTSTVSSPQEANWPVSTVE